MGGKTFDGISQKFVYKLLSSNSPQTSGFGEWVIRDKLLVRCGQISYSNVVYCLNILKLIMPVIDLFFVHLLLCHIFSFSCCGCWHILPYCQSSLSFLKRK